MNKQIKDLWEESQQWHGSDDGRGGLKIHESVEKFAELIVEECIAQCWTVSELESTGSVVSECSKRIRKHFGVEE